MVLIAPLSKPVLLVDNFNTKFIIYKILKSLTKALLIKDNILMIYLLVEENIKIAI